MKYFMNLGNIIDTHSNWKPTKIYWCLKALPWVLVSQNVKQNDLFIKHSHTIRGSTRGAQYGGLKCNKIYFDLL